MAKLRSISCDPKAGESSSSSSSSLLSSSPPLSLSSPPPPPFLRPPGASAWRLFARADISQAFLEIVVARRLCLKMSGEDEIIYINRDSDTDESISDDGDVLFSEDFSSEIVEDTSSFEGLTIDSELEDSDDSFEEESLPEIEDDDDDDDDDDGADGDDEDDEDDEDDDEVYEEILPEDLRRHSPSSVASPLTKRRRSSISDTFMRKCGEPLSPAVQAVEGQDNPDRRVLQPVAEDNREKLVPDTDLDPRDGGAQEINTVTISSNQPAVEAPLVFQKPLDSIPTNGPNAMIDPDIVGIKNIIPDMVAPFVYIPPNLEIPDFTEVIIRNNTVMMSNPTSEENQQDSFNPPVYHNFGIPVIPEAVLVNNPETVNYPPSTANTSGHQNLFSSTGPTTAPEIKEVVLVECQKKLKLSWTAISRQYIALLYWEMLFPQMLKL
nr:ribosome biogenesis protein erb1-like [Rattus norvegicus]